MLPSSNFGTSRPGGTALFAAEADPGNGVGRGTAGNANMPFRRTTPESFDAVFAGTLFSAAVPVFPSCTPLLFCWAANGNAKRALTATNNLRITFLPQRDSSDPCQPRSTDVRAARVPLVLG